MKIPISKRLLCCAQFVAPGARVADIGTDHGYLGIYLLENGIAAHVHACDLRPMPLQKTRENAVRFGAAERMTFLLSDGLAAHSRCRAVGVQRTLYAHLAAAERRTGIAALVGGKRLSDAARNAREGRRVSLYRPSGALERRAADALPRCAVRFAAASFGCRPAPAGVFFTHRKCAPRDGRWTARRRAPKAGASGVS